MKGLGISNESSSKTMQAAMLCIESLLVVEVAPLPTGFKFSIVFDGFDVLCNATSAKKNE